MAFGSIAKGEFGTYFIGYSRSPRTIEQMLENMFIGRPPGNYDRILDFSTAVTGGSFFIPTASFLDDVADAPAADGTVAVNDLTPTQVNAPSASLTAHAGSLNIGSLKGQSNE
jgi:putative iron-dependent peroxidase